MIQVCNLKEGFEVTDQKQVLLLWKYRYWKNGIPCHQFRKERMNDVSDVMDIDTALSEKAGREAQVNDLMNKMRSSM